MTRTLRAVIALIAIVMPTDAPAADAGSAQDSFNGTRKPNPFDK
jgi:hypothetical protein